MTTTTIIVPPIWKDVQTFGLANFVRDDLDFATQSDHAQLARYLEAFDPDRIVLIKCGCTARNLGGRALPGRFADTYAHVLAEKYEDRYPQVNLRRYDAERYPGYMARQVANAYAGDERFVGGGIANPSIVAWTAIQAGLSIVGEA